MKEKTFKFRESYGSCIKAMDDKTAGRFVKCLCDYVFDGKLPDSNDSTLKSSFTLVKTLLDNEKLDRENGRRGGQISAEMRRAEQEKANDYSGVFAGGIVAKDAIADFIDILQNCAEKGKDKGDQTVAKCPKKQAG